MAGELREWIRGSRATKPAALLCTFIVFVLCTRFEATLLSTIMTLNADVLMALLIFAHNSFITTTIFIGMLFVRSVVDAYSGGLRYDHLIFKYPRAIAAAFTFLCVLRNAFQLGWMSFSLAPLLLTLPVAAIEAYGIYLATLLGLRGQASARGLAKVYAVFFIGAIVETIIVGSIPYLHQIDWL